GLVDLDVQVAGGATAGADLALSRELDAGAVIDSGRELDRKGAAGEERLAAPGQGRPGTGEVAEARALRAGTEGHYLTQEGPGDLGDLAAAADHVPGLPGSPA
ncbi:hypothetical protein ADL06_14065, partial [Streptomyces sp. NRRL F-6491]